MNESRKTGLLRLRHLLEVTETKGEEMDAERGRFERLADPSSAPRVVAAFNLFQTPEPLAAQLAGLFAAFGRTLEPSAGLGRLYRAVRQRDVDCQVVLVENAPECCRELYLATERDEQAQLVQGDFLACGAERLGLFDSVIMNPPFCRGTDIRHIRHALSLLRPGGRLAAIVYNGARQRAALQPLASDWIDLPAGSFKGEGTNVGTAIVVIDAPTLDTPGVRW